MEQYFSKQDKTINGVTQLLHYILEDNSSGVIRNIVKNLKQDQLDEFLDKHTYVTHATESMPVFKPKE